MSRMILTVKPAPKITTIVRGIGQPGPQGPAGSNATATTDASLLVSGTLSDARLSSNVALENVANVFTQLLSFSGTDTPGLQLKSLTATQITALGAIANGSILLDSTNNEVDVRINGVTESLISTRGGQTINGSLGVTSLSVTGTGTFQFPSGTTAQRVATQGARWNTTTNRHEFYNPDTASWGNFARVAGETFTGRLEFSGAGHTGLRLNSLTTVEYGLLTPGNGDLFRDSTTDRIDARLARGTVELVDTAGGQTINGALAVSNGVFNVRKINNNSDAIASFQANNLTQQIDIGYQYFGVSGSNTNIDISVLKKGTNGNVWLGSGAAGQGIRFNADDSLNTVWFGARNVGITANTGQSIFLGQTSSSTVGVSIATATGNLTASGTAIVAACRTNVIQRDFTSTLVLYNGNVTSNFHMVTIGNGTLTNSSGVAGNLLLNPTINQTGTAGSTDFLINRTETALGSGEHNFANFQVGGANRWRVDRTGDMYLHDGSNFTRISRDAGASGRLRIFRPNSTGAIAVQIGGGNDELYVGQGGEGSFRASGGNVQLGSSGNFLIDSVLNSFTFRGSASTTMATLTGTGNLTTVGTITYSEIAFPELVTNGSFATDTAWTKGAGWTISGGTAVATGVTGFADIQQNLAGVDLGRTYIISFDLVVTSGSIQVFLGVSGSGTGQVGGSLGLTGSYSFLINKNPIDSVKTILFRGASTFTGTIDNVSVRRAF